MKADLDSGLLLANMVSYAEGPDDVRDVAIFALLEIVIVCYEFVAGLKCFFGFSYGRLYKVTVQVDLGRASTRGLCCYVNSVKSSSQRPNITEELGELSSFMQLAHVAVGRNSHAYERWCICLSQHSVCARQVSQLPLDRSDPAA